MDISRSPTIQRMIEQRKSLFQGSFQVFKTSIVSFPPKAPEDTNRCHFPNNSTPRSARWPPTCKQVNNPSRHNPRHTKTAKERIPHNRSHVAVEKEMIYSFLGLLTHATTVDHNNMPFPKVVLGEDLTKSCSPYKESSPRRSLSTPNTFSGKASATSAS